MAFHPRQVGVLVSLVGVEPFGARLGVAEGHGDRVAAFLVEAEEEYGAVDEIGLPVATDDVGRRVPVVEEAEVVGESVAAFRQSLGLDAADRPGTDQGPDAVEREVLSLGVDDLGFLAGHLDHEPFPFIHAVSSCAGRIRLPVRPPPEGSLRSSRVLPCVEPSGFNHRIPVPGRRRSLSSHQEGLQHNSTRKPPAHSDGHRGRQAPLQRNRSRGGYVGNGLAVQARMWSGICPRRHRHNC